MEYWGIALKPCWHVYLLRCSDGSLYCGVSNDVYSREKKHNAGKGAKYTRSRLPVSLVWMLSCESKSEALQMECAIKRLSKPAKEGLALDGGDLKNPNFEVSINDMP